jgi:hypothetical protein
MGEIADDMICGLKCAHCGTYFQDEHGHEVLCGDCYDNETEEERAGLPRATIPEMSWAEGGRR